MTEKEWTKKASDELVGRKIAKVEWLTSGEAKEAGWYKRPLVLVLDNGAWIYPMADDEGNDGGALATSSKARVWPVLGLDHEKTLADVNKIKQGKE
tara:strand:+ start:2472 stop:2759 length:288 start_codon:yes stop_codon:yes gene_type:complete